MPGVAIGGRGPSVFGPAVIRKGSVDVTSAKRRRHMSRKRQFPAHVQRSVSCGREGGRWLPRGHGE
jgi:hypothetical protein